MGGRELLSTYAPSKLSIDLLRFVGRFRESKNQIVFGEYERKKEFCLITTCFFFWKRNPPKLIRDGGHFGGCYDKIPADQEISQNSHFFFRGPYKITKKWWLIEDLLPLACILRLVQYSGLDRNVQSFHFFSFILQTVKENRVT